jgi:adenylate cyclase
LKKLVNISSSEFEKEIARAEYERARIMVGAFAIGFVITVLNYFLVDQSIIDCYGGTYNYFFVVGWLGLFIVYEFSIARLIAAKRRDKKAIAGSFKITHSLVEVTMVSLLIFYMVGFKQLPIYLDSPLNLLYYLFLLLSVLHLEMKISLLTGMVGAAQFAFNIWFSFHGPDSAVQHIKALPENNYYLDCVVLVVSAAAAGYVSAQVKRIVKASLAARIAKDEIEVLFGQQVSQEVVQALVEDKGLKKQEGTVLAMDIRNFTGFAESHTPDEILDYQNRVFGPILDIVGEYGGVVNQIMGDGLMATFGILIPNPRHAEMAFRAALKIRQRVKELVAAGVIPATKIGLGIHTGEVITGNIGNETRKQYSISGSAVIIAFRVEQLNKEFDSELLVTGEVMARIARSSSQVYYLGLKAIKGFEYEVDVYQAA